MTMQEFLASAAEKAVGELFTAYLKIPEDKRTWTPSEKARSAQDQVVECVQNNLVTVELLETHKGMDNMEAYMQERNRIASLPPDELKALLEENTAKAAAAIRAVPTEAMDIEIPMPWGNETVHSICTYPYWNMTYHLGQINQIGMILGVE